MDIQRSHTSKNPPQSTLAKLTALNLKLNQQLEVKVIQIEKDINSLSLQLTQSHKSIEVQSNLPLSIKQGQILKLLVSQLQPSPEFKILNISSNKPLKANQQITKQLLNNIVLKQIPHLESNTPVKDTIQTSLSLHTQQKIFNTLKQILPKQQQPEVLLNQIITNLDSINKSKSISSSLKQLAKEILTSLPQSNNFKSASQLKTSMAHSGLFLEAELKLLFAKNPLEIQQDFKAQLLKFQQALKQELHIKQLFNLSRDDIKLLKEILQKTENSLSRIILNQLTSISKDDGIKQAWIVDLPFLDKQFAQSIKLEIDLQQQPRNDEIQENWSVTITVTPPELATIYCKIICVDDIINTMFWSENPKVVIKINQHLDFLQSQFKKAGINPGHMSAHTGHAIKESQAYIATLNLLDQKA
ncbi:MAG: flagellar hook-length control protein FliK [Methylococcales bacterium]|nr:flagellar hook-length control protein FliK [Methylococcales bacterium]